MFAGRVARVRVAGEELASHIDRAFGHLRTAAAPAPFTIDLWDEAATGVHAPSIDSSEAGRSWGAGGGTLTSFADGRIVTHRIEHSTHWLDRAAQRFVGCVSAAGSMSLYERGKPLHYLLALWHNDRRAYVIHAGLVAANGSGILLAGAGGSGKSTTALACACGGFEYLADDCVALEAERDAFLGHSIFGSPWIEHDHLRRFPAMAPFAIRGSAADEPKGLVRLDAGLRHRLGRVVPIRAIVLPRVTAAAQASVRRATKGEALLALAPSSIVLFAPSPGAEGMRHLARLLASVPTYWLDLGANLDSIPRALAPIAGAELPTPTEGVTSA